MPRSGTQAAGQTTTGTHLMDRIITILDKRLDLDTCSNEELVWAAEFVTPNSWDAYEVSQEIAERAIWLDWVQGPQGDYVKAWGHH